MTMGNSVRSGNATIDYQVERSKRRKKTVQITVDGSGVHVAAPMTTLDREPQAIVRKRVPLDTETCFPIDVGVPILGFLSQESNPLTKTVLSRECSHISSHRQGVEGLTGGVGTPGNVGL